MHSIPDIKNWIEIKTKQTLKRDGDSPFTLLQIFLSNKKGAKYTDSDLELKWVFFIFHNSASKNLTGRRKWPKSNWVFFLTKQKPNNSIGSALNSRNVSPTIQITPASYRKRAIREKQFGDWREPSTVWGEAIVTASTFKPWNTFSLFKKK